jgi:hypothetical protein
MEMISRASKTVLYALSLVIALVAASASAYDRSVLIINNTSKPIIEFYGSNTGTQQWQEDILGVDVLPVGEEVNINFNDNTGYCIFDFKMVFDDGSEGIESRFNVCDYGSLTLTD